MPRSRRRVDGDDRDLLRHPPRALSFSLPCRGPALAAQQRARRIRRLARRRATERALPTIRASSGDSRRPFFSLLTNPFYPRPFRFVIKNGSPFPGSSSKRKLGLCILFARARLAVSSRSSGLAGAEARRGRASAKSLCRLERRSFRSPTSSSRRQRHQQGSCVHLDAISRHARRRHHVRVRDHLRAGWQHAAYNVLVTCRTRRRQVHLRSPATVLAVGPSPDRTALPLEWAFSSRTFRLATTSRLFFFFFFFLGGSMGRLRFTNP